VVVVGAGAAGMQCARSLQSMYGLAAEEVLVLEARPQVGGRVSQSSSFAPGHLVELGAEFIHGTTTRLNGLAEKHNWELQPLFTWAHGDGGPGLELAPDGGYGLYYIGRDRQMLRFDSQVEDFKHMNHLIDLMYQTSPKDTDDDSRTMGEYLLDGKASPRMVALADAGYSNTNAASNDTLAYSGCCKNERMWTEDDGEGDCRPAASFRVLLDALLYASPKEGGNLNVVTGRVVRNIAWDEPDGLVKLSIGKAGGLGSPDEVIVAQCAVVTVPLPALRDSSLPSATLRFHPPLPESKQLAAKAIGVGQATKLLLRFSSPIAPVKCHGIVCADTLIPEFWFRELRSSSGAQYLITGFAMGKYAARLADLGEAAAIAGALDQLAEMFPGTNPRQSLVHGEMHEWSREPFIHCGYTFPLAANLVPPEVPASLSSFRAFSELAKPLPNGRVMFAGEAYVTRANMTVHAALDAGARAAEEASRFLAGSHSSSRVAAGGAGSGRDRPHPLSRL